MAILSISHRIADPQALADRVVVVRSGRIVGNGARPIDFEQAVGAITGALVPAAPTAMLGPRPGRPCVVQPADVVVDAAGIVFATGYNAGLSIIEYGG